MPHSLTLWPIRPFITALCLSALLTAACTDHHPADGTQGVDKSAYMSPLDSQFSQLPVSSLPADQAWKWNGTASLITYPIEDTEGVCVNPSGGCYGLSHDISRFSPNAENNPAVFFQWFRSASHPNLKIHSNKDLPPGADVNPTGLLSERVNITYGSWHSRANDITYRNVELPFVIDAGHDFPGVAWFTLAVTPASAEYNWASESGSPPAVVTITAMATREFPTQVLDADSSLLIDAPSLLGSKEQGASITVDGHTWNGSGSLISRGTNGSQNETGFGVTLDWARIHPTSALNPVVFFQWEIDTLDGTKLEIRDVNNTIGDMKVTVTFGGWDNRDNDVTFADVTLPFVLDPASAGKTATNNFWYVVKVAFSGKPSATCPIEAKVVK